MKVSKPMPEIGSKWKKYNRTTLYVRGIIDDQVIVRFFDANYKVWVYDAIPLTTWDWLIERVYIRQIP